MNPLRRIHGIVIGFVLLGAPAQGADPGKTGSPSTGTYKERYGDTGARVSVDPAKELPRFPAVEPRDALATFQLKRGFKLEFAAHEPQVRSPIAVSFDERGRMFVCEMIDYSEMREAQPHLGRISVLEDRDGDGYFETSTVFADNLAWPTALICYGGGVFVGATPDIWWLKDNDGDGRADVREKVFTGFGTGLAKLNVQALMNSFNWGLDNRIHLQSGSGNRGEIRCLRRPDLQPIELGARDFWFDPRTFEFGTEAGGGQYGFSYDTRGRKFVCSNSDHLQMFVYDDRYAARNPYYTMPAPRRSIASDGGAAEVFRISPDEPWRILRTRWRVSGVVKGAVEGGGRVSGYFTGATGTTVYRGDAYGPEFVDNTFTGDAGGNLVHRKILHPDGVLLTGKRPADEQGFEFLASRDTWFRPVHFANAPDGCLYLLDMYREVIEHPWSIPEEIKQHLDLNSGNNRGRIYRIAPENFQRRPKFDLGKATTAELVATLDHPNGWHRDTAARLLHERKDETAVPLLQKLALNSPSPLGRLHALRVLDGFKALTDDVLLAGLKDDDAGVREHAVKLAEPRVVILANIFPLDDRRLVLRVMEMVDDPDAGVRFQIALTLGEINSRESILALIAMSAKYASPDVLSPGTVTTEAEWIRHAVLRAAGEVPSTFFSFALGMCPPIVTPEGEQLLAELARITGAKDGQPGSAEAVLSWVILSEISESSSFTPILRALGEGLQRSGRSLAQVDTKGQLKGVFTSAAKTATDSAAPEAARTQAIALLALTSFKESGAALASCLSAGQPEPVQLAAIHALGRFPDADVGAALLKNWTAFSPRARSEVLSVLFVRPARATALLRAIEAGTVARDQLNATQIEALQENKDKQVAALAAKVLPVEQKVSREEILRQFNAALTLTGDAARGRAIYAERCLSCHVAEKQGHALGPDLATVKTAGRERLLTSIIDPNREIAPQYLAFNIETRDGESFTGIVTRDDAGGVTLRQAFGREDNLARAQIKSMRSPGQSLMPEGLEAGLTPQQLADLLSFIEELK